MSVFSYHKQFKRIVYIPGIISLCILPVLFYSYNQRHLRAAIPIAFPAASSPEKFLHAFSEDNFPVPRTYTDIKFTGDQRSDELKLAFARLRTKEILSGKDSLNGLHFSFAALSNYGIFVRTIDMLRSEKAVTYAPLRSDLWFYYIPPRPKERIEDLPLIGCGIIREIKTAPEDRSLTPGIVWASSRELIICFAIFLLLVLRLKRK